MPKAQSESAESPQATTPSTPVSTKDKLALIISLASLVISASTFAINRVDAANTKNLAEQKHAASAFQLGKRFATGFVIYVQTRAGDADAVAAAKKDALDFARYAQAYAISLDLNIDLANLIENYRYKNSISPEDPSVTIEARLATNYGPVLAGKFSLGYWLSWLHINSQAAHIVHPEYLPQFKKDYPKVAALINEQLTALGVPNRMPKEMPDLETGKRETLDAMHAAEKRLAKRGG